MSIIALATGSELRGWADAVAARGVTCLDQEVATFPKPGLVSHRDSGSHHDMDAGTFRQSAEAIRPYLAELALAGAKDAGMGRLRVIGLEAEAAMLVATDGINTHRGAIFGLGLLAAAAGRRHAGLDDPDWSLGRIVAESWGHDILNGPVLLHSHGQQVRRDYGMGGARVEAAQGFPCVYRIGVPALAAGERLAPGDDEAARVHTFFALLAEVEDTNLVHRGGLDGLASAREMARGFLDWGGVGSAGWRGYALAMHIDFIRRNLSPGGVADLLAMRARSIVTCSR